MKTKLNNQPIGIINPKTNEKKQILISLLASIIDNELVAAIIRKESLFKRLQTRFSSLKILNNQNVFMYAVTNKSEFQLASELICSTKPWHKSSFVVLVGQKSLLDELKVKFGEIKDLVVPEMEEVLDISITGYFFPVDAELIIYGTGKFREILSRISAFEPN